ncbi:MAG: hypothetical protein LBK61_02070 [Spirochaetaceae bacterium]|nr:hypothetical protein [Spirochaetaceae bacterium]
MTDICPNMIVRPGKPDNSGKLVGKEINPNTVLLVSSPNVAHLQRIVCDTFEPTLLRVLVCKDEKSASKTDSCPYPEHKIDCAVKLACKDCKGALAQIYTRLEKFDPASRSCIVVFIAREYLSRTDDLLERLLCSVEWLNIELERPRFYIFYYGEPMLGPSANNSLKHINDKIKQRFKLYSQDEDTCIPVYVKSDAKFLIIKKNSKSLSCTAS